MIEILELIIIIFLLLFVFVNRYMISEIINYLLKNEIDKIKKCSRRGKR